MLPILALLPLAPPRIGHATRAQILAALPASLREIDPPDPQGVARYARLVKLGKGLRDPIVAAGFAANPSPDVRSKAVAKAKPILAEVESLLREPLRVPTGVPTIDSFPRTAELNALAKTVALATRDAAARKDQAACAEYATLGLRLGERTVDAKGTLIELLIAMAVESIAQKAALDAELAGGFDAKGRVAVLAALPVLSGPSPLVVATERREFQREWLPMLLDPIHGAEQVAGLPPGFVMDHAKGAVAGNYDPIATAKLLGPIYEAAFADAARPVYAQTGLAARLAASLGKGLPKDGLEERAEAVRMNAIPNSIGRALALNMVPLDLAKVAAQRAARRNLVRMAFLLRMGGSPSLPDPFSGKPLRFDPKRRIVWSVGQNLKDDGGRIGEGQSDLGVRY